ncbi:16S rRNA (cytidine(1402)-2'-O)-methyltransferase [Alicyclobacillus sp. SO9]|uniref:16S rRNA (cytidine(1402)-2'-O)-methyltransferase n=1 Tax=Alicyclobacillus sp. SO9 TaxID=2665646 RepID=UPI0018E7FD2C|nr:16S rRNA (cytidine(1402)-2'-O)-methyltransferase [Alicyclobacillus sp. SO9]QQE79387.1 16S rRNA (cytidine(1402)-2'-O)-methyltransferase [Alicyclobacillus sp. SO9]
MQIQESFLDESAACLYVCSTPIGNLQDVSLRLLQVLRDADVIAAEDTRQTRKLLTHFEIHPRLLTSYHLHNEKSKEQELEHWWAEGKKVALVSDAGTPGVSDPGFGAVRAAIDMGIPVIPVPGASASIAALISSGLRPQPFLFIGFLPKGQGDRRKLLEQYQSLDATLVIYESPHRLAKTVADLDLLFAHRQLVLAKELTKKYETFARGTASEVKDFLLTHAPRGEYVIVVGPPSDIETQENEEAKKEESDAVWQEAVAIVEERVEKGMRHKQAVEQVAAQFGIKKRQLYQATLRK